MRGLAMARNLGAGLVGALLATLAWMWIIVGRVENSGAYDGREIRIANERDGWHSAYGWTVGHKELTPPQKKQLAEFLTRRVETESEEVRARMAAMILELRADDAK
jgi:hypothetical protein